MPIGSVSAPSPVWVPLLGRIVSIGAEVTLNGAFVPCKFKSVNVVVISATSGASSTTTPTLAMTSVSAMKAKAVEPDVDSTGSLVGED